jgi:hypothetical protein
MALTDTDRRRFMAATVLTLLALPALWWANTSDNSAAPNLAVAGIDVATADDGDAIADSTEQLATAAGRPEAPDGEVAPVFLDGPASAVGAGQAEIAVPARPLIDRIVAKATFRSSIAGRTCIVPGVAGGSEVTIVNLANNRSVTCTSVIAPGSAESDVVMHTSAFGAIADLTDAPISVEIRR